MFFPLFRRCFPHILLLLGLWGVGVISTSPSLVTAAPSKGYEAQQTTITGGGSIQMKPGETKDIAIGLQNIGTAAWEVSGAKFVSLYTYEPKYRPSLFAHPSWISSSQPTRLSTRVPVGSNGFMRLTLRAPQQAGTYKETFYLAAEDTTWIPGGLFTLTIDVASSSNIVTPPSITPPAVSVPATTPHQGLVLLRSSKHVTAKAGERVEFTVGIKNTGTTTWNQREIRAGQIALSTSSATPLISKQTQPVTPGMLDFFTFSFLAPSKKGEHQLSFILAADGTTVSGGEIAIPVEVTTSAPEAVSAPVQEEQKAVQGNIPEPVMRIGVLIVDEETNWEIKVACSSAWSLQDTKGNVLLERKANKEVTARYKDGAYWYETSGEPIKSTLPLRFIPSASSDICTATNFDRRITRRLSYPDNAFRGSLELRYNSTKERTWLINEVPMEFYLRGLAETSNISHQEFQKALVVIARTYALYHFERATKYKSEFFHITSYSWDQVYNGYGQEQRTPRLTESVQATVGKVVRYDGKTAITPYFSRSDGRTRSWSEVWYGDVPWLKGVPAPCDLAKGKDLWGHGVGLSASEALCQANQGKRWDEILHYFYRGVTIDRMW